MHRKYFFLIVTTCVLENIFECAEDRKFKEEYQWHYVNFTWNSPEDYQNAIAKKIYIPGNSVMTGLRVYQDKLYMALPRIRHGTPVTLGYIDLKKDVKMDSLVTPFPNWEFNELGDCNNLQNVQSMDIDKNGIMWIIDGRRNNNISKCPPKLVLVDLNTAEGDVLHTYTFPEQICSSDGGYLNDLVVDDDFVYITENSQGDPGLIVYSRKENKSWKLRDSTMFPELNAANITVSGVPFKELSPIDGISLSPTDKDGKRTVYYCSLTGYNLYSISTDILKNESWTSNGEWRTQVEFVGKKQGQSGGLMVDHKGDLYYGLLTLYAVAKWNIYKPFSTAKIIEKNKNIMIWTDSFGMDGQGNLYLTCNNIPKFADPDYKLPKNEVNIRILKMFTGTKSYIDA